jgi:hypothetical protein
VLLVRRSTSAEKRLRSNRKVIMCGSAKDTRDKTPAKAMAALQNRRMNHLKDEVYREMLLLEVKRPGSEMGLALALLRAVVASGSFGNGNEFGEWLETVCPLGLHMIELALGESSQCNLKLT